MKKLAVLGLFLLAAGGMLLIGAAGPATGQIKKGKTRPLKTKTLMGKVVQPNCAGIGKGLKAEEVDWEALAASAELLNECSYILVADSRCPDKTWADATTTLRECSGVLLEKIEAQDGEAAQGAFAAMTKACGACHKAHK